MFPKVPSQYDISSVLVFPLVLLLARWVHFQGGVGEYAHIALKWEMLHTVLYTSGTVEEKPRRTPPTPVRLFLLEEGARLLGHVPVAVHVGEVGEDGLDGELVEVAYVFDAARVVHFPLDRLRHVGAVDKLLQDRGVSSSIDARGDVELVVEVT